MSGNKQLSDYTDTKIAAKMLTSSGAVAGTMIDATAFRRAHFVFTFGTPLAGASILSGAGIWNASTSGATFALQTDAQFASSFTTAQGSNAVAIIDTVVDAAKPWLLVSGLTVSGSNFPCAVIVQLYNADASTFGTNYGASAARIVTV